MVLMENEKIGAQNNTKQKWCQPILTSLDVLQTLGGSGNTGDTPPTPGSQ